MAVFCTALGLSFFGQKSCSGFHNEVRKAVLSVPQKPLLVLFQAIVRK